MKEFFNLLSSIHELSLGLQQNLLQSLKTQDLERKGFLLTEGELCKSIYYIEKGLLRCFYTTNSQEVCSWFMKEGDLIISVPSFFPQKPSYESIQALEDCSLLCLGYDELQKMYWNFLELNFVARVLTEKYYVLAEERLYSLRKHSAPERYAFLREKYPELIQRVPSKYLASYLGISEETLSRIKSKI
ncbi:Crp/Fnr family transcriptional regulator [Segetibacter koreensis]|uniref:Crp/Fnr family transcriptional regulator n=1 Tax=Segetibacter koreensis TaxID=398037 RepID=UPI0003818EA4|nr:Crp/Fnr family transcriptional regulator [Segetibacter koreensis]